MTNGAGPKLFSQLLLRAYRSSQEGKVYTGEWAKEEDGPRDNQCHWTGPHPVPGNDRVGRLLGADVWLFSRADTRSLPTFEGFTALYRASPHLQGHSYHPLWGKARHRRDRDLPTIPAQQSPWL